MNFFPQAITLITIFLGSISLKANASEPGNNESPSKGQNMTSNQQKKMTFTVSNDALQKKSSADSTEWIEIDGQRQLVLKRKAKGKIIRGNVILLHTDGENPDHRRVIQPLSIQLAALGWNILMPNIAQSDFPEQIPTTKVEAETELTGTNPKVSEPSSAQQKESNYFESATEYQAYFSSICAELSKLMTTPNSQTVIVTNQLTSYWSIDCSKQLPANTAMVFLQPQLPVGLSENLDSKLSESKQPLFTFIETLDSNEPIISSIRNNNWGGLKQRFNSQILSNSNLAVEDIRIAKTITGWIKTLESESN